MCGIQEHAVPLTSQVPLVRTVASRGLKLALSPPDPLSSKPSAGVAIMARRRAHVTPVRFHSKACVDLQEQGRAQASVVDIGASYPVLVVNVYGWTGAKV
eukprot:12661207-Alexandrium_andersonii.AAC.1